MIVLLFIFVLQDQAFKSFDIDAKKAFEKKEYQKALTLYQEAYRLQPKAKHYRVEGNYTDTYLPLYSIALCQEQLDILDAAKWAEKSKIALEEEVLKKNRKKLSDYHASLKRILDAAAVKRAETDHTFQLALEKAKTLLQDNQFTEARNQFEELSREYPNKSAAEAGIQSVDFAENNFYQSKIQSLDLTINSKQVPTAEAILRQLKTSFPSRDFTPYEQRIAELKKPKAIEMVQTKEKPPEKPAEQVTQRVETIKQVEPETGQKRALEASRKQARKTLVSVISSFKKIGDPDLALKKLAEFPEDQLTAFASYHWVKGMLSAYSAQKSGEPAMVNEAHKHIRMVLEQGYKPDLLGQKYPVFFVQMVESIERERKPE